MNRIILTADEVKGDGTVTLTGERAEHIRTVLKARVGDDVRTGVLNDLIGTSRVERLDEQTVVLRTQHDEQAPEPWFDLILAAPRPKVLKRLWSQLAALGAGRIVILKCLQGGEMLFQ